MTSETMAALAERVEALAEPCRETDAEIALMLKIPDWRAQKPWKQTNGWAKPNCARDAWSIFFHDGMGGSPAIPNFTASLDAAMTLTTGFILCHLSEIGGDGLPMCALGDPSTTPAGSWSGFSFGGGPLIQQLARATTAAALRARAAMEGTQ